MNLSSINFSHLGTLITLCRAIAPRGDFTEGIDDFKVEEGEDIEDYINKGDIYFELGDILGWSRDESGDDVGYDEIGIAIYDANGVKIEMTFTRCSLGDVEQIIATVAQALR